ncbi:MAG: hypothetical protein U9N07_05805 [Euryarchaeota archaeon]|nr:hypothetical protein [Euryarchaeota archaeon]
MEITRKTSELLVLEDKISTTGLLFWALLVSCIGYYSLIIDTGMLIFVIIGVYLIFTGFIETTVEINKKTGKIVYSRKNLLGKEDIKYYNLCEINKVYLDRCSTQYDDFYTIIIMLKDGKIKLPYDFCDKGFVGEISDFLNVENSQITIYPKLHHFPAIFKTPSK